MSPVLKTLQVVLTGSLLVFRDGPIVLRTDLWIAHRMVPWEPREQRERERERESERERGEE